MLTHLVSAGGSDKASVMWQIKCMYSTFNPLFLCLGVLLVAYPDVARWLATIVVAIWFWRIVR